MAEAALVANETVAQMIARKAPIEEIGAVLDALDHDARWAQLSGLGKGPQRDLYELAASAPPISLEHFVPADVADVTPVRHEGRNTLPSLPGLNLFAKVFARKPDGSIVGYNDSPVGPFVGPGYYTAVDTPDKWQERGPVVVDYYQPPADGPVPSDWPRIRPNWMGLQILVYFQTRDFMRRVSTHVSIGAAYKWDNMMLDNYFVLCRVP